MKTDTAPHRTDGTNGGPPPGSNGLSPTAHESALIQIEMKRQELGKKYGLPMDPTEHFRRPVENTFTEDQRESTTILMGGLSPRHDRLLEASVQALGYDCKALPNVSLAAYELAKEYGNNGQCNPTYFTVGTLVKYVQDLEAGGMDRQEIIDSHVFVTAGACGTCRFGMYESEYRFALGNAGFDEFRVQLFGMDDGIDQSAGQKAGLDMNLDFFLGLVTSFNIADVVNQYQYQIRGYEMEPGAVDAATEEVLNSLADFIRTRKPFELEESRARFLAGTRFDGAAKYVGKFMSMLFDKQLIETMEAVRQRYDEVELDPFRVKPIVKMIGEFWAQTTEGDGNFNMHRFLGEEGAEVYVDRSLFTRLSYSLHMHKEATRHRKGLTEGKSKLEHYKAYYKKRGMLTVAERILKRENDKLIAAMGGVLHEMTDQYEMEKLSRPYWDHRTSSGESHLEIAENIYYHTHDLCHMVLSLKPFTCMPSTQSDGVQTRVVEDFPGMIFLPIETSGDGEIIAHSRVQMALGGARTKARKEMADVLAASRWSLDEMKAYADEHPHMKRASYKIPHHPGIVGRAANFALHVGDLLDKRSGVITRKAV